VRIDPSARAVLEQLEAMSAMLPPPPADEREAIRLARGGYLDATTHVCGPGEEVGTTENLRLPGARGEIPVRIYRPPALVDPASAASPTVGTVLYLHGGAWVMGSPDTHDGVCRALCAAAACTVVSVDYRLAPESPFPAGLEDAWSALSWVSEHAGRCGAPAGRIAVAGDSAGGGLAAALARRARDRGGPRLALQLLVYPALDSAMDTPSYEEFGDGEYGLGRAEMEQAWRLYLGRPPGEADLAHGELCPARAPDLEGLAPALVLTAELDPLRDEGERYAERLYRAGVPTRLIRYHGLPHGFLRWRAGVSGARRALDEAAEGLRHALRTGGHRWGNAGPGKATGWGKEGPGKATL
jgi:acetyl esterase